MMGPTHNLQRPTISQANCATVHLLWTGYSQFDTAVIVTWVELVDLKADSLSKIARKNLVNYDDTTVYQNNEYRIIYY